MRKAVIHPYYVTLQNKQTFSKHVGILCATNNKEVTDKLCVAHVENLKDCHSSFSTQNSRCGLVCLDFSLTQAFQPLTQPPPSPQPCKLWFTIALDFHLCVLLTRVDRNRRPGLTAISQLDLMVRKPAAVICFCFTPAMFLCEKRTHITYSKIVSVLPEGIKTSGIQHKHKPSRDHIWYGTYSKLSQSPFGGIPWWGSGLSPSFATSYKLEVCVIWTSWLSKVGKDKAHNV